MIMSSLREFMIVLLSIMVAFSLDAWWQELEESDLLHEQLQTPTFDPSMGGLQTLVASGTLPVSRTVRHAVNSLAGAASFLMQRKTNRRL